jgi:hypothetical protein
MNANDDDAWLFTLGLIGLFRSGVSVIVSMFREVGKDRNIASAIAVGQLGRWGKLRGYVTYRVHSDQLVAMLGNDRIEFNLAHPEAFSAYLLRRHIELNRKLKRFYPQYVGVPVAIGLEQLAERGLICASDPSASLFTLTQAGLERLTVGWDTLWEEIQARA